MPESVIGLGEIESHLPTEPWVLVFGGVTREGNRRARRAIRAALQADLTVLWFDGFSERWEQGASGRVELDPSVDVGSVIVVDYAREEQRHWLNRIVDVVPAAIVTPVEKLESGLSERGVGRVPVLTSVRRTLQKAVSFFQKKVLRRVAQVFRGLVGWRMVRADLAVLGASATAPRQIIYADDFALTQGWRAARMWPEAPTSMDLIDG